MAKRTKSSSLSAGMDRLTIPGVNIGDILEFESIFPEIRFYIATLMLPIVVISQIRLKLMSTPAKEIQGLSSVNLLNRSILAKSPPLLYVTSAVAIRRTAVVYADQETEEGIITDHQDLCSNPSGPIITRGGLTAALRDPASVRKYRRGLMAQATGEMQSTPIHSPRRLARDVDKVTREDFLSRLPFPTDDFTMDSVYETANSLISPNGDTIELVEQPTLQPGDCPLESGLLYTRVAPVIPSITNVPADISKLPPWKRAAVNQAKSLGGGQS